MPLLSTNAKLTLLRYTQPLHNSVYTTFGFVYLLIAVINTILDAQFPTKFEYSMFNVIFRLFWVIAAIFMFWQARFSSPSTLKNIGYLFSWCLLFSLIVYYVYYRLTLFP